MARHSFFENSRTEKRFQSSADKDLIAACLNGDAAAWDALISRYAALIFATCLRMGVSQADAEDVFQDACMILLNHLDSLREATKLASWLISTTKREVWRLQKRRGATLASELGEGEWELEAAEGLHSHSPSPEADVLALTEQQVMRQGMQKLPDRCRRLLTLLYVADPPASYTDIAEELSMPIGSLGPTRARCLQSLRKLLAELGY